MDSSGIERVLRIRGRNNQDLDLPDFAKAAIVLGRDLYRLASLGTPYFVTIVTPTKEFFSLFVALGALEYALSQAPRKLPSYTPEVGEKLYFFEKETEYEIVTFEQVDKDGYLVLASDEDARYRVPQGVGNILPVPLSQNPRIRNFGTKTRVDSILLLLTKAFNLSNIFPILLQRHPLIEILGVEKHLRNQAQSGTLHIEDWGDINFSLQDLLVARNFRVNEHLTNISPYSRKREYMEKSLLHIYDGAEAILADELFVGAPSTLVVIDSTTRPETLSLLESHLTTITGYRDIDNDFAPILHPGLEYSERAAYKLDSL